MASVDSLVHLFRARAEAASAFFEVMAGPEQALEYAVRLCKGKEIGPWRVSDLDAEPLNKTGAQGTDKSPKTMAAPELFGHLHLYLKHLCESFGITLITQGLRDQAAGLDMGITYAHWGIAETGTIVLVSPREDVRLASMISDVHVALLPISRIRKSFFELEADLAAFMKNAPNYTAFITGASRTADIERVLTLGAHGPLELHILLLEESDS
jgi:L-lactate dehydrogenase complex protein LldG